MISDMKRIIRFNESKESENVMSFDIKSYIISDEPTFNIDLDVISDKDVNKIKKEIQNNGETPGLDKSIKKFEDFKIEVELTMGDESPKELELIKSDIDPDCLDIDPDDCCDIDPIESPNIMKLVEFMKKK